MRSNSRKASRTQIHPQFTLKRTTSRRLQHCPSGPKPDITSFIFASPKCGWSTPFQRFDRWKIVIWRFRPVALFSFRNIRPGPGWTAFAVPCRRLRDFARLFDEKLRGGVERAILQSDNPDWHGGHGEFNRQNLERRSVRGKSQCRGREQREKAAGRQ